MREFRDAKIMAHSLRDALQAKAISITHSDSLELMAQAFGFANWNILAAKIAAPVPTTSMSGSEGAVDAVTFAAPIPIIRIFDVEKAKDFYLRRLGFNLVWEHRFGEDFPLYAQIVRSGVTLHLSEHSGDGTPGSNSYISMQGLDAFHRELVAQGFKASIEDGPGNNRTLQIWDPFSNRLRFAEAKGGAFDREAEGYVTAGVPASQ